jgi:hypothetical protein
MIIAHVYIINARLHKIVLADDMSINDDIFVAHVCIISYDIVVADYTNEESRSLLITR